MPPKSPQSPEYIFSSENLLNILDVFHCGIAIHSADGLYLYANKAYKNMFKMTDSEPIGRHVCDYFDTGEQGMMTAIKTKTENMGVTIAKDGTYGIAYRIPILDRKNSLICAVAETIITGYDRNKINFFKKSIEELQKKLNYFEWDNRSAARRLHGFENIVGESLRMREIKLLGERFARGDEPVLILGESGTGKELVAQAVHMASPRKDKPFIPVNCAALPRELIESELFGYAPGAFSGSRTGGMKGKFEMADNGSIFLDEIGELPLSMQSKLLRVLESGEVQKLSATQPVYVNFRLIAATNRDLEKMVRAHRFREDLYYRLKVLTLPLPPLREHPEDIALLIRIFFEEMLGFQRAHTLEVSPEVLAVLKNWSWPGNVRELKNLLSYTIYMLNANDTTIELKHLPAHFSPCSNSTGSPENADLTLAETLKQAEISAIKAALKSSNGNRTLAARQLGISRSKLYAKLRGFTIP